MNEIALEGGNLSEVYTDGKIVYKTATKYSKTIHRYLKHLEEKGIEFVPKSMGFDKTGREMLSFVSGETMENYPDVSEIELKIQIIRKAASMLRQLHDASVDFKCLDDDKWFLEYNGYLSKNVICHNDFAPYNVTFDKHIPVGIIDFDTVCPAPREWDLAYAIYRFVPLSKEVFDIKSGNYRDYDKELDAQERKILINEFLESYDISFDVKEIVIQRLESLVNLFDRECAKGNESFIKMKNEGHQLFYVREVKFLKNNYSDWE